MHKLMLALTLLVASAVASAADSPKDVQALIASGNYPAAEAALRDAIKDHPQSAKAHYVLAEVLAHEGNIGEAKAEATKAASIDPATRFTDPAKFQAFQRKLDEALAPASNTRRGTSSLSGVDAPRAADAVPAPVREAGGSSHLMGPIILVIVIALVAFLWMRRRNNAAGQANGYPPTAPPGGNPPYGSYNNGYNNGPYPPQPPPRSGVGTAVAAGLGGVAAGMLLDEALRSHNEGEAPRDAGFLNGNGANNNTPDPSAQAYDDLRDDPIDMGNDDSSWDDSSSGDGGSSDDDSW
jgi:tetratricopeptide (TPR) repeat protein